MKDKNLDNLLRIGLPEEIEPSAGFEARFWKKILEHRQEPFLVRFLKDLECLIPIPSLSQAFAVILTAFFIGGAGGVFSAATTAVTSADPLQSQRVAVQYLSGFGEAQGVPSVAGAYLQTVTSRRGA